VEEEGIDTTMHVVANHQIQRGKEKRNKKKSRQQGDAIISSAAGPMVRYCAN
jgi:hypothetical protein